MEAGPHHQILHRVELLCTFLIVLYTLLELKFEHYFPIHREQKDFVLGVSFQLFEVLAVPEVVQRGYSFYGNLVLRTDEH